MADNSIKCFYFGVQREMGHYLYVGTRMFNQRLVPDDFPVNPYVLDGRLLPPQLERIEGRAELIHFRDWTILTFWDSSFDTRPGSSSAFIISGHLDFTEAVKVAKEQYPQVWSRFKFEVYQR